jgi:hypothetical protein
MTHDELLARIDNPDAWDSDGWGYLQKALRAVVELCATLDEVTIGDKGLFNSGRNSMREEIKQAIEKEVE